MANTKHTQKRIYIVSGLLAVAGVLLAAQQAIMGSSDTARLHSAADTECDDACLASQGEYGQETMRQAERLQARLQETTQKAYSLETLAYALVKQDELLSHVMNVSVNDPETGESARWTFEMKDYADAVALRTGWLGVRFEIDRGVLLDLLTRAQIEGMKKKVDSVVTAIQSDGFILRTNTKTVARNGFVYDMSELTDEILDAIAADKTSLSLHLPYAQGEVTLRIGSGSQKLDLLSTGISDYSDSPDARISNVKKAVNERVNNTVVAPGEKFSFVSTLGGPVTIDKGWKEALGLFGGGTAMTPGGGICQAATTVFRGALLAGLPIVYKRNHSVFVDHYEPYGVGLDATIFPGVHDMVFQNDTKGYIVLQSYMEGINVYVNMYGIKDQRTVELDGPYFMKSRNRPDELRPLGKDQIGWVYRVTYPDGTAKAKPLVATYSTGFMKSVVARYSGHNGKQLLEISRPQEVAVNQ